MKEREERKQRRLLEERGQLPEQESQPVDAVDEEQDEQDNANAAGEIIMRSNQLKLSISNHKWTFESSDEVGWNAEDLSALNAANQMIKEDDEESNTDKSVEQQTILPVPWSANQPKIHSRKFRE